MGRCTERSDRTLTCPLTNSSHPGEYIGGIPLPESISLEERETTLKDQVEDREAFLQLMRKMLQWEPEKRSSAKELLEDEWLRKHST